MRRLIGLLVVIGALCAAGSASADVVLPSGFTQTTQWSGLGNPTVIRFAPDGKVFVASKSGIINVFDNLQDPSPTQFVDLRTNVHDYWDRGLLGMALDPQFTTGRPYVYVLYAYDKAPNSTLQPRWGDGCPTPPGGTDDGCVISGRLSRLAPNGAETVLIEDWCQQYPSHSTGSIEFGPDGQLYVSSGDGASFNWADYGQDGNPINPCGDPGAGSRATAQGGAVRSQAFRRPAGQAVTLDGSILRVNPDTGAASDGNPAISDANVNRRRIVAHGLRNPFRITFRPGTGEIWSGDVGWNQYEEINRTQNIAQVRNYGWPCYEGTPRMSSYDTLDINSCETLYSQGAGAVTAPYFAYHHNEKVVTNEACPSGGSSISGLHFYTGTSFPAKYRDALFFSDFSRKCIWVAYKGADGLPDMSTRETFASAADGPVWLTQGPDGALYYADLEKGNVRRIASDNGAPTARITATPRTGVVPLTVNFDGTGSTDPENRTLTYAWDLDGDGGYDDSTASRPSFTYRSPGTVTVRLSVTDPGQLSGTTTETITVGAPPTVSINVPTTPWAVGDTINFSATSSVPASGLTWSLRLRHCSRIDASVCHTHAIQDYVGVASSSFVAPDHEYPSHLELSVTARDTAGVTTQQTATLMPRTSDLTIASEPAGLEISLGSETLLTPFTRTVLARSANQVSATPTQPFDDALWTFGSWSGASATGAITAPPAGGATVTGRFTRPSRTGLAGAELVGQRVATAPPGRSSIYQLTGAVAGTANSLRLWVDASSRASRLGLALYSDASNYPGSLLGSATVERPVAGAWNTAFLPAGVPVVPGRWYWLSVLNPPTSTGTLAWTDRAATPRLGQTRDLSAFPSTWVTAPGSWQVDGHVSGGAWPDAAPVVEPTPTPTPTPTGTPTETATPTPTATAGPCRSDSCDFEFEPVPQPAMTPTPTPTPDVVDSETIAAAPKLVGAWSKTLSLGATRSLRAPVVRDRFTLMARVRVTRAGTIVQRGSAFKLTTRGGQVGKSTARLSVPRARWTHVAMTYDGTTVRTYRNGKLVASKRAGTTLAATAQALRIGGFKGRIRDIRLYDGALSATEIARVAR
ncbi:PQQ-dependent sugar dehydrogenase [Solirubrobacter taibaiensis]|nr:PQQ-dependent sugar dehydrogenase [Solirubrobacter taibaiensis]